MGLLLLAALTSTAPSAAQPAGMAPSAQELYGSAQQAFDKGKYAEALILFRQAYDSSKSPNARLMVGHCLIGLGRPAEAYEEMTATMREAALRAEADPKYAKTRDSASTQLALLEAKVGKIVVEVAGQPADVKVMLNGDPIAADRLGTPIAVDPGSATIVVTRADGVSARREETVESGQVKRVTLEFPKEEAAGPKVIEIAPKPITPLPVAPPTGGGLRKVGFVVAGVGVVGVALFAVAGAMAKARFDDLNTTCHGAVCPTSEVSAIDGGKALETAANVGLGVGIAGLVGGGLMIGFGGPSSPQKPAESGFSLSYSGSF